MAIWSLPWLSSVLEWASQAWKAVPLTTTDYPDWLHWVLWTTLCSKGRDVNELFQKKSKQGGWGYGFCRGIKEIAYGISRVGSLFLVLIFPRVLTQFCEISRGWALFRPEFVGVKWKNEKFQGSRFQKSSYILNRPPCLSFLWVAHAVSHNVAILAILHLCLLRYFPSTNLVDRADNCYTSMTNNSCFFDKCWVTFFGNDFVLFRSDYCNLLKFVLAS